VSDTVSTKHRMAGGRLLLVFDVGAHGVDCTARRQPVVWRYCCAIESEFRSVP
jgi:hypothetical protein